MESDRSRLTYPDSTYITYDYDELNRMTAVRNSSGTALASYNFDDRSRRTGLAYANEACVSDGIACTGPSSSHTVVEGYSRSTDEFHST